ncbi:MAG: 2Fe-2S ferredoxin [Ponticaulis sp.]|nr:2Fe-2S ferredoxin [Ponticaulis sp.]|tara:strand:+ start:31359 stop:32447 length:1089 start_codon:yes stop_codon:yes gene_type:complete
MATAKATPGQTEEGWLTDSWYFISTSKDLKAGEQRREIMLGQPVLIGRTKEGKAFALRDICPHRLVPLSAGKQIETEGEPTVECPYHGWRFGTDGVCKHMPSLVEGDPYDPSKVKVRTYPIHEANGMIFVYIADNPRIPTEPVVPPPDFGTLPDKPKFVVSEIFNAHMDDAVVGLMDPAHVPFVHNQWWWRPPSSGFRVKEKPFEPITRGWTIAKHQPSGNSLAYKALFGGKVTTEIAFQIPGFRWEVVENEKVRLFTLTCLTPIEPKKTRITQVTYWNSSPLLDVMKPILIPAARMFLNQDGTMVDLQNEGMKYQKNMLWIDDIDVQAKWYQTLKRAWVKTRTDETEFENPIEPRTLRWRS